MSPVLAVTDGSALWYLARGSGVVSLLLLTAAVLLGIGTVKRLHSTWLPRFLVAGLHRNVTLLALSVLVVHIASIIIDGFAPITVVDALVPFTSAYRPLWVGLGALAFDLVLSLIVTSLLRGRLGVRLWRGFHWAAYVCWPVALLHGLGTGTDASTPWMVGLTAASVVAVTLAVLARVTANLKARTPLRAATALTTLALPLAGGAWFEQGPLQRGWATRAGTPESLRTTTSRAVVLPLARSLTGTVARSQGGDGQVTIAIDAAAASGTTLELRLVGPETSDGGVEITTSTIVFGTSGDRYAGSVGSIEGSRIRAALTGSRRRSIDLTVDLAIDWKAGSVGGTIHARQGSA